MPRRPSRRRTNRSRATNIERRLDDLAGEDRAEPSPQTVLLAALKDTYDADLSAEERAALADSGGTN
jgi:hypothetical protein